MTFAEVLADAEPLIVKRLLRRTAVANKLAKCVTRDRDRTRFYEQKAAAVSRLLVIGGARVDEVLITSHLVTVCLANGCRQHIPLGELSAEAKAVLEAALLRGLRGEAR
jgi:hypothetical protein